MSSPLDEDREPTTWELAAIEEGHDALDEQFLSLAGHDLAVESFAFGNADITVVGAGYKSWAE